MKIEDALKITIRFGVTFIGTSFIFLSLCSVLISHKNNFYFWLWSCPFFLISILDIFFLLFNLKLKPKDIDMKLSTVVICLLSFFTILISNHAISYSKPTINIFFKPIAVGLNILTYPLILSALFTLRNKLAILPEAHSVVKTGPYKYSRHPLYLAYILSLVSGIFLFNSYFILVINTILIILFIVRAKLEEKILEENIEGYKEYKNQTQFIPGLKWL